MQNYFNYFTEIEERFSERKGMLHLCSTMDWALMDMWKEAGVPLEVVLRGIDAAFDNWEKRPERHKVRRVNSLAFCAQEVLSAAQKMASASVGSSPPTRAALETGFEQERVSEYLARNADELSRSTVPGGAQIVVDDVRSALQEYMHEIRAGRLSNEEVEQRLTVHEEKLFAAAMAATANEQLMEWRAEAERELAPYKRKMQSAQIAQLQQQFVHKRLLEQYKIPRLSLFYLY
ncbi:MAG: hypothetical protein NVS9B15_10770 [Acidobacteriaceae bacterium]